MNGQKLLGLVMGLTLALGGRPALAAETASSQDGAASPPGEIIQRTYPSETDSPSRAGNISLELLGGTLGGALGGASAGLGVAATMYLVGGRSMLIPGLTAGGLVSAGALSVSVWGTGKLLGGQGRLLPTAGGTLVGLLGGALLLWPLSAGPFWPLVLICPPIGTVIGYELSHSAEVAAKGPAAPAARVQVMPLVSASPSGGLMGGLVGRF